MKDNLQVENGGYTRIVNSLLEEIIRTPISSSELRVIMAVIRKTYGFHKSEDSISLSQIVEMTTISKRNVIYIIQNLEAKNIFLVSRSEYSTNIIRLNKYFDTWVVQNSASQVKRNREIAKIASAKLRNDNKVGVVQNYSQTSAKLSTKVVQNYEEKGNSFAHTKEKRKQKKTKENANTDSIESEGGWNWIEYRDGMEKSNRRDIEIIGYFFKKKGVTFENKEQVIAGIKRWLRVASSLKGFSDAQLTKATQKAIEQHPDIWTLETILKKLTS